MATIKKRGNSYSIRVSCGYDMQGKQIIHSMTWKPEKDMTVKQMEKEAQRQAVLFEEKCRQGLCFSNNIRFADFAEKWFTDYAEKQLKAKTIARYKELLKRINQAIGHIKLNQLQPIHLLRFYDNLAEENIRSDIKYKPTIHFAEATKNIGMTKTELAKKANISINTLNQAYKGKNISYLSASKIANALNYKIEFLFEKDSQNTKLSPKTIQHYHRLISSILQTAVQWQVILYNPCERIKPPKAEQKESRFLDDVEVLELFHCLDKEAIQYKALITLLVYTGMRRGEILGLKWSDIDFNTQTINIQRAVLYLPNRGIFEDSTKTSSSQRIIKVADTALQLLKEYKKGQNIQRLQCGDQWHNLNYIFTSWNGKPMHPDSLTAWFKKFITKYNLPSVSIHSLRHTNASLLISNGVNITTVSKRLGHATTATTTKIYAHAIQSADEAACNTLQNILKKVQ